MLQTRDGNNDGLAELTWMGKTPAMVGEDLGRLATPTHGIAKLTSSRVQWIAKSGRFRPTAGLESHFSS